MKQANKIILSTILIVILAAFSFSACTQAEKPAEAPESESVSTTEGSAPVFFFTPVEGDFASRKEVYKELYRLENKFADYLDKYGDDWSEEDDERALEALKKYKDPLDELLSNEFKKKSEIDILEEKKYLIEAHVYELHNELTELREKAEAASDPNEKAELKKSVEEKEKALAEANEYYSDFLLCKHKTDEAMTHFGLEYDENADPLFIPEDWDYKLINR